MNNVREVELRLATPLFLGESDPRGGPADVVRPPAIKGALRFWWRALAWSRWGAGAKNETDRQVALETLRRREGELFGAVAPRARQSCVTLRTEWPVKKPAELADWPPNPSPRGSDGSTYLGWGIVASGSGRGQKHEPHRIGWTEGGTFRLSLQFSPRTSAEEVTDVLRALEAWTLFGGLGARARRGFGSVSLVALDAHVQEVATVQDYRTRVAEFLGPAKGVPAPPYSAFGPETRWGVIKTGPDARATHRAMGAAYKEAVGRLNPALRPGLGLPIPKRQNVRRASPLWLHVHPVGSQFVGTALWLPSDPFLPGDNPPVDLAELRRRLNWFDAEGADQ